MIVKPTTWVLAFKGQALPSRLPTGRTPMVLHVPETFTLIGVPEVADATVTAVPVVALVIVSVYSLLAKPAAVIVLATAVVTVVFVALGRMAVRAPSRAAPCIVCLQKK